MDHLGIQAAPVYAKRSLAELDGDLVASRKHRSLVREALRFSPAGHRAVGDYGGLKPTLRLP